jgi:hypothetical protein
MKKTLSQPNALWESIFKPKGVHLVVGFDEAATKASPKLMPEARRNLCWSASHSEERETITMMH